MMSLRNAVSEDDWLSSMILLFRNEMNQRCILIVVEGISDIRFFNAHRLDNRIIYESPENGKREVISAVSQLRRAGNNAVYGVCDADFDELSGINHEEGFYTDAHDLEMMLVKGGVVDKFIMSHTDRKLIQGELANIFCYDVKMNILCACYKIGLLKWYNYLTHSNLNFKGINYRDFVNVNRTDVVVDESKYINYVLSSQALPSLNGQTSRRKKHSRKKHSRKKSQRSLNQNDMLEALQQLQTRGQEIFGKS
ncbi:DUF4435 domain-containing protein [Salmonella enterica subsp. enterica serovar Montevideo]